MDTVNLLPSWRAIKSMLRHELTSLRFMFPPLFALVFAKLIFELTGFDMTELSGMYAKSLSAEGHQKVTFILAESQTRLMWSTTVLLYFTVSAYFIVLSVTMIRTPRSKWRQLLYLLVGGGLVLAEIGYFLVSTEHGNPISAIFTFTYDTLTASGYYRSGQLTTIRAVLYVINLIAAVVPVVGMLANCSTVAACSEESVSSDPRSFIVPFQRLRHLLNIASIMMVVGVLHMNAWMHWPAVFAIDQPIAAGINGFSSAVSLYWGAAYSVMIVAFYVPSALWMNHKVESLVRYSNDAIVTANPRKWIKDNQLSVAAVDQFPQIIAMFAPLLAGPMGTALAAFVTEQ